MSDLFSQKKLSITFSSGTPTNYGWSGCSVRLSWSELVVVGRHLKNSSQKMTLAEVIYCLTNFNHLTLTDLYKINSYKQQRDGRTTKFTRKWSYLRGVPSLWHHSSVTAPAWQLRHHGNKHPNNVTPQSPGPLSPLPTPDPESPPKRPRHLPEKSPYRRRDQQLPLGRPLCWKTASSLEVALNRSTALLAEEARRPAAEYRGWLNQKCEKAVVRFQCRREATGSSSVTSPCC